MTTDIMVGKIVPTLLVALAQFAALFALGVALFSSIG